MVVRLVFFILIAIIVLFITFVIYQRLPAILYPILAKITGENIHDQLRLANERATNLELSMEKKDALIHELDLSAQAHGYPEITRTVDRFRRENPSDSIQRRY